MPGWRNGRRGGLKSRCSQGRAGSSPAPGIEPVMRGLMARADLASGAHLGSRVPRI